MRYLIMLILPLTLLLTVGCEEEEYDCDAAETEVTTLGENLIANITMANCSPYNDKVKEYVDEGCGTNEECDDANADDGDYCASDCEELVCTVQTANFYIYIIGSVFAPDSTTYCAYFDSLVLASQEMVNAGGCATQLEDEAMTQASVDSFVSGGCDWGDSTTVNRVNPFIGELNQLDAKETIEELVDELPDNYSNIIRKRFDRILSN